MTFRNTGCADHHVCFSAAYPTHELEHWIGIVSSALIKYDPRGFHGRIPAEPHNLTERVTPDEKTIVLCHMGVPILDERNWTLGVGGMVRNPLSLTLSEIKAFPKAELTTVHQCAGSPVDPERPTQRVCNTTLGGARLRDVLDRAGVEAGAAFVWSEGFDSGSFREFECGPYIKDIGLDRVDRDVLIAYEMNGQPLSHEHGYPARLFIPGYYGTNSVKWLRTITLASSRVASPFTTKWYTDFDETGARTVPVWSIAPQSVVVSPTPRQNIKQNTAHDIWGWAWGDEELASVQVSIDKGQTWHDCKLEPRSGHAWQRFECNLTFAQPGLFTIKSRARSISGAVQPEEGRRNAIYSVPVNIVP
ncbi:MAG: sulfite oxidase-like oxidoreductase [Bradyrhizobiaceae bacterium]|nr:MAG: sulfite oxidase-like oxidoreductase [Bradyrhizobiaceae bacterium]